MPDKEEICKATAKEAGYYEEDIYEQKEEEEDKLCLVCFRLGKEWYGVETVQVVEVAVVTGITYLPSAPVSVVGVANLRGNILPVVDLKRIFGLPIEATLSKEARLIVLESKNIQISLLVDEVANVVEVPLISIAEVLSTLDPERARYLKGELRLGDKLVALLNTEKLFEKKGARNNA